jgi:CheY-like chemotaxis protein
VVDDTADVREAVVGLLRTYGYDVESAVDGLDAVEKLERGLRPGVILLDLAMPRMSGFAFRRWQVADSRFAEIPVVVFSGVYDPPRAQRLSGLPVVSKSAEPDVIVGLIGRHLGRRPEKLR